MRRTNLARRPARGALVYPSALRRAWGADRARPAAAPQDQRVYDALRLRLRSARTTLEPAPGGAAAPAAVQPAAPAADGRSEGGGGGGGGGVAGAAAAAGDSSSDAIQGAFGSAGEEEPKPMDE